MPYTSLSPEYLKTTALALHQRIAGRFPERGLAGVSAALSQLADDHTSRAKLATRPLYFLRCLIWISLLSGAMLIAWLIHLKVQMFGLDSSEYRSFESIEATFNVLLLVGAAAWFLLSREATTKQDWILRNLHELRSIAHVIDMHQLSKNPIAVSREGSGTSKNLNDYELMQYLDYCCEMLALTGKLAALYMRGTHDSVVIQAINEIEELTTQLSAKIWQKVTVIRIGMPDIAAANAEFQAQEAANANAPPTNTPQNEIILPNGET